MHSFRDVWPLCSYKSKCAGFFIKNTQRCPLSKVQLTMHEDLRQLLTYTNSHVLQRYEKDYPRNVLKAEEAWPELLKFLWLSQKLQHDRRQSPNDTSLHFQSAVHEEMQEIDDMWHTFILFTQDYTDFCQRYFGRYLHHQPTTEDEATLSAQEYQNSLENYLSYIYDHLGEETVIKWFRAYD